MALELLCELANLQYERELKQDFIIVESVSNLLKPLTAKINMKPDVLLQHVDAEVLSAQLATLISLGQSSENREAHTDFARKKGEQYSPGLYQFLSDIAEPHTEKAFGKDHGQEMTADQFLIDLGNTSFKSETKKWAEVIQKAQNGDTEALSRLKTAINKLNEYYANVMQKLQGHFDKQDFDKAAASAEAPQLNAPA